MREIISLNRKWAFIMGGADVPADVPSPAYYVNLPYTWNAIDGQDGGNDYYRGLCWYVRRLEREDIPEAGRLWLELRGANSSADVYIDGRCLAHHDGGYSTWRVDVTQALAGTGNPLLAIGVDNAPNETVYPQMADFTFYGGLYRDVNLIAVPESHFDLGYYGGPGVAVTPEMKGEDAVVRVQAWVTGEKPGQRLRFSIADAQGNTVAEAVQDAAQTEFTARIAHAHRWHGRRDPYLYTAEVALLGADGGELDRVRARFGCRSFEIDPERGFILNGEPYPLRGVSRHQDRWGVGNALLPEHHEQDMDLICEVGATTIRLAHYQHDQYFYDLCDQYGMVVWAEIPYISEHMPHGRENTISQMKELIEQNYNHASIVCWGVSNEITISTKDKADMLDNHRVLNDLCHEMDPTRFTTLACYAMCGPFNKVAHITDTVSWNLYLGWYVPGMFLNDLWIGFFHLCYPKRMLGYSEYGAEGMPNLHSEHPRRNDHTEEYQAKYHEFMVKCFKRHPYMWATHVWNMFDFAADARDQGGEPGMNHKGLVTFDRKTKKDSFYLYKASWGSEPLVHICSKRFAERCAKRITVKVYSTEPTVTLRVNGRFFAEQTRDDHVFTFRVPLEGDVRVEAVAGKCRDSATFRKADRPNPDYVLKKSKNPQKSNWV